MVPRHWHLQMPRVHGLGLLVVVSLITSVATVSSMDKVTFGEPRLMGPVAFPRTVNGTFVLLVNDSTGKQDMFASPDGKAVFGQWGYGPWNGTDGVGAFNPTVVRDPRSGEWHGWERLSCTRANIMLNFAGDCLPAVYPMIQLPNKTIRVPAILTTVGVEDTANLGSQHSLSNMEAAFATDITSRPMARSRGRRSRGRCATSQRPCR